MCGVAGIFAYHYAAPVADREELLRIRDHMARRGPDGCGDWRSQDGRVHLGHRRLSIIDLSERGAQPMADASGDLVITFNGEIYNHRAIRHDLEKKGYAFRSNSDTEVLLHLYSDKGEAMVHELRGMFAFALWDRRKGRLLLARDPYGIKPLYYADDGWTLRFASQVKALLAGGRVSRLPDPAGAVGFHLFGCVPDPYTLFQEIRAVPAGSIVRIDDVGVHAPLHYFSMASVWREAEASPPARGVDIMAAAREALRDSVRHHLVADVPVGAFLSAGIDSGALLGLMRDVMDDAGGRQETGDADESPTTAITLAFAEYAGTDDDESPLAAEVASRYRAVHKIRYVGEQEFGEDLESILEAMDQPSIDGINTWFVSKAAREAGLKVAVSGLGGDELFGGYPSFTDIPRWVTRMWLPARVPGLGRLAEQVHAAFPGLFAGIHPKAAGMLRHGGRHAGAYLLRRGLFLPGELPLLLGEEVAREGLRRLRPLDLIDRSLSGDEGDEEGHRSRPPRAAFAKVATLESTGYLRNQLLRDADWASMAHSLEVRLPLVDAWLLRALAPLLLGGHGGKDLLARSPSMPLPDRVVHRRKTGFTMPVERWRAGIASGEMSATPGPATNPGGPWARRWAIAVSGVAGAECVRPGSTP